VSASGGVADCGAAGVIIIVEASNYGSKSGLECSHNTQPGENKSTLIQTIIVINP
jgi:hypothetical protein